MSNTIKIMNISITPVMASGTLYNPFLVARQTLFCFLSLYVSLHFLGFYTSGLSCVASYAQQNYIEVHLCCCVWQIVPFYHWSVIFHCMAVPPFIFPSSCCWTFELFQSLASQIKLLWMSVFMCLYGWILSFLFGKCLSVVWLDHVADVCVCVCVCVCVYLGDTIKKYYWSIVDLQFFLL